MMIIQSQAKNWTNRTTPIYDLSDQYDI